MGKGVPGFFLLIIKVDGEAKIPVSVHVKASAENRYIVNAGLLECPAHIEVARNISSNNYPVAVID
ncbi:hypothetical protein ES708_23239 [subsurface metagenome]